MKWKIHNIFYVSLLEQDITRKGRVDNKALLESEKDLEFETGRNKGYEVKQFSITKCTANKQTIKYQASINLFCERAI